MNAISEFARERNGLPLQLEAPARRRLPDWANLNLLLQAVGAVFGLGGQWYINHQSSLGFVCWLISNVALVWLQVRSRLFVLVALHIAYFVLSVQGLLLWMRISVF